MIRLDQESFKLSVHEMHGAGLQTPCGGWMVSTDCAIDRAAVSALTLEKVANLFAVLEPEFVPSMVMDPTGLCLALASHLLDPLVLHVTSLVGRCGDLSGGTAFVRCRYHDLAGDALRLAIQICEVVKDLNELPPLPIAADIRQACGRFRARVKMITSHAFTNAIVDCVAQAGIPFAVLHHQIGGWPLLLIGVGASSRLVCATGVDRDSFVGGSIAKNKSQSQHVLSRFGFPVPRFIALPVSASDEQICAAAGLIGYPCVVKPGDADLGVGVTVDIRDSSHLLRAYRHARSHAKNQVIIEQYVSGDYHRLVVIGGELIRVLRMLPPALTGDGMRSINEILCDVQNGIDASSLAIGGGKTISLTEEVVEMLGRQGMSPRDVPAAGARVVLRQNLVDRSDWLYQDVLSEVDNSLHAFATSIAASLSLANVGIDIISPDITLPVCRAQLSLIEVNAIQVLNPVWAGRFLDRLRFRQTIDDISIGVVVLAPIDQSLRRSELQLRLAKYPDATIALSRSTAASLEVSIGGELLDVLSAEQRLLVYGHPREVWMNRSLRSMVFLIDWDQLCASGLPAPIIHFIDLLGVVPDGYLRSWQQLVQSVLPRSGIDAYCHLPAPTVASA